MVIDASEVEFSFGMAWRGILRSFVPFVPSVSLSPRRSQAQASTKFVSRFSFVIFRSLRIITLYVPSRLQVANLFREFLNIKQLDHVAFTIFSLYCSKDSPLFPYWYQGSYNGIKDLG